MKRKDPKTQDQRDMKIPFPKTLLLAVLLLFTANPAFAQGPVQPEAMQFEPVDVTDVVNLATGDFVYTIPIMSVPGPEGDYPVVLSYHSGVGPNQPATWIGLGWTLNPGAVNRTLSGYPDDYKGDKIKTVYQASSQSSYALNLGAGWGPIGVNMSYSHHSGMVGVNGMLNVSRSFGDSGFGIGGSASFGTGGFSANSNLSGSRLSGSGGALTSGALSVGTSGVGLSGGATNGRISAGASAGRNGISSNLNINSVGASLSSSGLGGNFSVAGMGFSSVTTAGSGNIEAQSRGITIPLPGDFWVSLGYSRWKWRLNEEHSENSYGVLYQVDNPSSTTKNERHATENELFPSYDAYQVSAQGMSGSFIPVLDHAYVLIDELANDKKGKLDRDWDPSPSQNYDFGSNYDDFGFRFLDDTGLNFTNKDALHYGFGYDQFSTTEYSSKKIEPYIASNGKIIGFKMTSIDGMIYEFKQPVYNIYQYTESKINDGGTNLTSWNSLNGDFATSWLLTEIKGPDYVDRDSDGQADNGDWGYWVSFEYDFLDMNIWRTPYTGHTQGSTEDQEQFTFGIREVYYLSSIETQTHKAVFETANSANGNNANVSLTSYDFEQDLANTSTTHTFQFFGDLEWIEEKAAGTTDVIFSVTDNFTFPGNEPPAGAGCPGYIFRQFTADGASGTNNVDFSYDPSTGFTSVTVSSTTCTELTYTDSDAEVPIADFIETTISTHQKLDAVKLYNKSDLVNEITKSEFTYDYSLRNNSPGASNGALTLKEVHRFGQSGAFASPPYRFSYAHNQANGDGLNPNYNVEGYDFWGSYKDLPLNPTGDIDRNTIQEQGEADLTAAWSLTRIETPTGSEVDIEYESDDFFRINDSYFFTDAKVFTINTVSSSGSTLHLTSISSGELDGFYAGVILEKHEYSYTHAGGGSTAPGEEGGGSGIVENITDYNEIGEFLIEVVNETSNTVQINASPTFKTSDANNTYSYTFLAVPTKIFGGGSRVKSVTTTNGNEELRTLYLYKNGLASSGVTASLPADYVELDASTILTGYSDLEERYKSIFLDHHSSYGRPSPGVIYSKVQVMNVDENNEPVSGFSEYEFYTSSDYPYLPNNSNTHFYIYDYSGIYGKPKSITYFEQYEEDGSDKFRPLKRSETLYTFSDQLEDKAKIYLSESTTNTDDARLLGITQHKHISKIEKTAGVFREKKIERTFYNVFNTGQVEQEYFYSTSGSGTPNRELRSKTKTIGYDSQSGIPIVSVSQLSTNSEVAIAKTTPAWWKYSGMKDKNMLSQTFESRTYRTSLSIDNDANLLAYTFPDSEVKQAEITTWSNSWPGQTDPVWRKNDTYMYVTDQTYQAFPTADLTSTSNSYPDVTSTFPWQKTSNIVSYDQYGHATETVNEDGTYQTVKYNSGNTLVLAVASNARSSEVAYYNFETAGSTSQAHTGGRCELVSGSKSYNAPSSAPIHGGNYRVGVWLWSDDPSGISYSGYTHPGDGTWRYAEGSASASGTISFTGNGCIDDLVIAPQYSSVSYFSYDPVTWKVAAMTGPDQRTSYYEYDNAGRLTGVRDQDKNLLQSHDYSYGQSYYISPTTTYFNPNEQVTFNLIDLGSGVSASGDYKWSYGDGIGLETTNTNVNHTYTNAGVYNVSVTFTDTQNRTIRTSKRILVGNVLEVGITINHSTYYGESGTDGILQVAEPDGTDFKYISVEAVATPSGGVAPYSYQWYKSTDNGVTWNLIANENSSTIRVGEQTLSTSPGVDFDLKVKITDADLNTMEAEKEILNID